MGCNACYNKGELTNCYYLNTISNGVGNGDDTTIICTEEELTLQSTFWGFDFDLVWEIDNNQEYKYPQIINIKSIERRLNVLKF